MLKIDTRFVISVEAVDDKNFKSSAQFRYMPEMMESPYEIWQLANLWIERMSRAGHHVSIELGEPDRAPF